MKTLAIVFALMFVPMGAIALDHLEVETQEEIDACADRNPANFVVTENVNGRQRLVVFNANDELICWAWVNNDAAKSGSGILL